MNLDEKISIAVENSIQSVNINDWETAKKGACQGFDNPEYSKASRAIMEPSFDDEAAEEAYHNWTETNTGAWAGFIRSTFGADWGDIADVIKEEGY